MADVAEVMEVQEQEQKLNMMDYMTIPVAKFEELLSITTEKKAKKKYKEMIKKLEEDVEKYRRWWHEEEVEKAQLRKTLDDAKALIAEKLGVNPDEFLNKAGEDNAES